MSWIKWMGSKAAHADIDRQLTTAESLSNICDVLTAIVMVQQSQMLALAKMVVDDDKGVVEALHEGAERLSAVTGRLDTLVADIRSRIDGAKHAVKRMRA